MTLPLTGVTIMELGSALAGPYCCRILADLGADVIKVEPPGGGDSARDWGEKKYGDAGAAFHAVNRHKRSITVNIKDPAEVERLLGLIVNSVDIVVQNMRPGVVRGAGLGDETIRALKPSLIYCNVTAYGSTGPLSDLPGYEALAQAMGGVMNVTGPADGPPARVGFSVNDLGTALWSAIGVLGALHARDKTGQGATIDTSIFETAIAWQVLGAAGYAATGEVPKRSGLKGPLVSPNTAFQTADGLHMITIGTDQQFRRFCASIGRPDLADDPRFAANNDRTRNEAALADILQPIFIAHPRRHWWDTLNAVGIPNAPVQSLPEALAHEQTVAGGLVQQSPDGSLDIVGCPLKLDGERLPFRAMAPKLGEANEGLLDFPPGASSS